MVISQTCLARSKAPTTLPVLSFFRSSSLVRLPNFAFSPLPDVLHFPRAVFRLSFVVFWRGPFLPLARGASPKDLKGVLLWICIPLLFVPCPSFPAWTLPRFFLDQIRPSVPFHFSFFRVSFSRDRPFMGLLDFYTIPTPLGTFFSDLRTPPPPFLFNPPTSSRNTGSPCFCKRFFFNGFCEFFSHHLPP